MKKIGVLLLGFLLVVSVGLAGAATVFSNGTGAVTSEDHGAYFDDIKNGDDLSDYEEDGISVSVADMAWVGDPNPAGAAFNGSWFNGDAGNMDTVSIAITNGAYMSGLVMGIDDGQQGSHSLVYLVWQTWKDGSQVTAGTNDVPGGEYYGFSDSDGFDELRIGAYIGTNRAFGDWQSIVIDNLSIQLAPDPVPEPATMLLFGLGLLGLAGVNRRKQ